MAMHKNISDSIDLPNSWIWTTIGAICIPPQYGWTTSAIASGKLRLLRTSDITSGQINWQSVPYCQKEPDKVKKYVLKDGDIVISRAGSVGYSILVKKPEKAVFASYLIRFRPLITAQFVAYFLKSPQYWQSISEKKLGIAVPNVNATKLKQIRFPLAPLPEQHRIVAKIEDLFTKLNAGVAALKKIKVQLKRYRQVVLKHAFEGKLTENWRKTNNPPLFPLEKRDKGRFDDLRELPRGWQWINLGNVSDRIHYGYTASGTNEPIGPKMLRITDIQSNTVDWDAVPYCQIGPDEKMKYLLNEGDLVFARTGATVGKSFLITGTIPEAVFASYLIRIILNNMVDRKYVYNFFQSQFYWSQIRKGQIGIGQPNVNSKKLAKIMLPLPHIEEQHQIVAEIERRFAVADEIEKVTKQSIKQSQRLRQSILKQAFKGRLVPQYPDDEPASELLERIRAEKAKHDNEKSSKKIWKRKTKQRHVCRQAEGSSNG